MIRAKIASSTVKRLQKLFNDSRIGKQGYTFTIDDCIVNLLDMQEDKIILE